MMAADMSDPSGIDGGGFVTAKTFFTTQVLPSIVPTCGGCHRVEGGVGPGFLKSANPDTYDPYLTMVSWPDFIRLDDPAQSRFVRKGVHEGPALVGFDTNCNDQCGIVLEWLKLERNERLALVAPTFKPAVKPLYPTVNKTTQNPKMTTQVDLGQLGALFTGAYLRFIVTELPGGRGVEISDLRLFNVKTNPRTNEQRTIRMQRPLFVVWNNGSPLPDPGDNFAATDRTIRLFQDDDDADGVRQDNPGTGNLIIPGLFTLTQFRAGSALSVVFDVLQVLPPLPGTNPCTPAGLNVFNTQVTRFLGARDACARSGCHHSMGVAGGINMADGINYENGVMKTVDPVKNKTLCEELKFYNAAGTLERNSRPGENVSHPYRFRSDTECITANLGANCHAAFVSALNAWKAAEN